MKQATPTSTSNPRTIFLLSQKMLLGASAEMASLKT
jgi:hypothetical protein